MAKMEAALAEMKACSMEEEDGEEMESEDSEMMPAMGDKKSMVIAAMKKKEAGY